jgi:ATP-dependent DNA helicase RecQ
MTSYKTIICLANSRKKGGYCIAGKEIINHQVTSNWVRPVSDTETGELYHPYVILKIPFPKLPKWLNSILSLFIKRQFRPQVLDIITVPLVKHKPHAYQRENYLIDIHQDWIKETKIISPTQLTQWCDVVPSLWINDYHSSTGLNDRIPLAKVTNSINSSLLLIIPEHFLIKVLPEKVRAEFVFNQQKYSLVITDPQIEKIYRIKPPGDYPIQKKAYLCISLSEPFKGHCYKLVAAVILE